MKLEQLGPNERADDQASEKLGYHFDTLFDQNEDESGSKIDLATGKPIKNDENIKTAHGMVVTKEGSLQELKKQIAEDESLTSRQKELQKIADELLKKYGSDELGTERILKKSDTEINTPQRKKAA